MQLRYTDTQTHRYVYIYTHIHTYVFLSHTLTYSLSLSHTHTWPSFLIAYRHQHLLSMSCLFSRSTPTQSNPILWCLIKTFMYTYTKNL